GLPIHDPAYLVRGDKTPLEPGMCFSNEPMIVLPGRFGVRLEDHFHVTGDGGAWFTEPSPSIEAPFGYDRAGRRLSFAPLGTSTRPTRFQYPSLNALAGGCQKRPKEMIRKELML